MIGKTVEQVLERFTDFAVFAGRLRFHARVRRSVQLHSRGGFFVLHVC